MIPPSLTLPLKGGGKGGGEPVDKVTILYIMIRI